MSAEPDVEDSEEEEDEEGPDELPPPPAAFKARSSVSAEAFGEWNKREAFQAPVYDKTPEQFSFLSLFTTRSFLFSSLDATSAETIVRAMKGPLVLEPGHQLITEGDDGNALYVIEAGTLDCFKLINGENLVVKTCVTNDVFGELALLYNCPRKASVVSRETSTVWELDRSTFNNIVIPAVQAKRERLAGYLHKMSLFSQATEGEVENVIDSLKLEKHPQGTTIIQQGDSGEHFYIVYEGEVVASKHVEGQEPSTMAHGVGDYFGELSLLNGAPRAATVAVSSAEAKLLSMDSAAFKRLMGNMEDYLQRTSTRYA